MTDDGVPPPQADMIRLIKPSDIKGVLRDVCI
jgi:hypothetical protein